MALHNRAARVALLLAAALAGAAAGEPGRGPDEACGPQDVEAADEASLLQSRGKLNQTGGSATEEAVHWNGGFWQSQTEAAFLQSAGELNQTGGSATEDYWNGGMQAWQSQTAAKINPSYQQRYMSSLSDAMKYCSDNYWNCRGFSQRRNSNEVLFGWSRSGTPSWDQCCEYNGDWKTWLLMYRD